MDFESKRERRIERLQAAAQRARSQAETTHQEACKMADAIPFGQPILIGHHSEKRDRNYRNRIGNKFDRSFALQKKASSLEARAEAAANNNAIFSDDPNAAIKLEEKIELLQKRQEIMVAFNKALWKNDKEAMLDLGFSEQQIERLSRPDFCGRVGYADYMLKNNSANINRLKKRLEAEKQKAKDETTEKTIGQIKIVDNVEENRLQMFFPDKPEESVRKELKSSGFRFSYTQGCWQRHRSNQATWHAERIAKSLLSE